MYQYFTPFHGSIILHCMDTAHFIYPFLNSSAYGPLNYFHLLAIMNDAALNIHIQVLPWVYIFICPGYIPRNIHWKDWCWSWSSNTLATWCEKPIHWKRPWCWERLKTGREGDNRRWDDWMASPTQWTWVWANSGRWWRTGKPGVLQSLGLQRVRCDWATEQQSERNNE